MKILIVSSIFPPQDIGGPATFSYNLSKFLQKKGDGVSVITFGIEKEMERERYPFLVKKINVRKNIFLGTILRQFQLFVMLINLGLKSDIIFAQDALTTGLASVLAAKILRKPIVIKFVGDIIWEDKKRTGKTKLSLEEFYEKNEFAIIDKIKFYIQKWCLKNSNKIIVPAKYLKDFITKYYSLYSENIRIIYNGVKILPVNKKPAKNQLITVGRLVVWKNIDQIIKILPDLPKNIRYEIIGTGPEEKNLRELVQRTDLCNQIKFLGKLSNEKTIKKISASQIFILNSSYEGSPHVLLEAASVKTSIIAPKLPGIAEIFSQKEITFFKPRGEKELKKAIKTLLKNPKKREAFAKKAFRKIKNKFSWETTARNTQKLLKEIYEQHQT